MIITSFVYSGQEIPSFDEFEVYTQDKDNKILIILMPIELHQQIIIQ